MIKIFRYMLFVLLCVVMYACGGNDMEIDNEPEINCDRYNLPVPKFEQTFEHQMEGAMANNPDINNLNKISWQITKYNDHEGILDDLSIRRDTTIYGRAIVLSHDTIQWVGIIVRDSSKCLLPNPFVQEEFFFF